MKALRASYAGLALTVAATILPFLTRDALADHIARGYPAYSAAETDEAVATWLVGLTVVGVLGAAGWLWTIWTLKARKPWARWSATLLLATATGIALAGLTVKDTSGELGLAPALAWAGLVPCLAGLYATARLWSGRNG
jgi:hypothetical protein